MWVYLIETFTMTYIFANLLSKYLNGAENGAFFRQS